MSRPPLSQDPAALDTVARLVWEAREWITVEDADGWGDVSNKERAVCRGYARRILDAVDFRLGQMTHDAEKGADANTPTEA